MAEIYQVLVDGKAFADTTTLQNAASLVTKINKRVEGKPATLVTEPILYNPKHVVALDVLKELGYTVLPDPNEEAEPAPKTTTRRKRTAA